MEIYSETINTAKITLTKTKNSYIVELKDKNIEKKIEFIDYETAIKVYDRTCEQAAEIHKTTRQLPELPNFKQTIKI